jgi:methionyl-tRNA formyltransferase
VGGRAGGDGSRNLRVVFVGNAPWSVPSLESLAASDHEVARVLTRAPRAAGRGKKPAETAVAGVARSLGLPLLEVETVRAGEGFDAIHDANPDVLVVVAYGEILPESVLALPRLMPVNVHFSLLPALRGAAPVQRAILNGLLRTGVTTMRMDAGMDTGPILLQRPVPIGAEEDAGGLGHRLADIGGELLVETLDRLAAGTLTERPQDEAAATIAPKLTPQDERIDWHGPADEIARRVRALSPAPGASTTVGGSRLKVYRVSPAGDLWPGAAPGQLRLGGDGPLVATGRGALRLDEVQAEGRRRLAGGEWARGARLPEDAALGR